MITFEAVSKWFGDFQALRDVDGVVARGETVVLCGPSGSGKSTLIRTVNRLETTDKGRIVANGVEVGGRSVDVNTLRRQIGFVFQALNLFPHLRAIDNVALPLVRVLNRPRREARETAAALLERVGLSHRLESWPAELSGGEQQRVAIARTLALDPPIILLDEPTSALDPEMVGGVLAIIQGLAEGGRTIMCVTHEMGFAREAADRIWFMSDGAVVETASPADFFDRPRHPRTQQFLAKLLHR